MGNFRRILIAAALVCFSVAGLDVSPAAAQQGPYQQAFGWYRKAAEAGNPQAQYFLALQYERGWQGGPANPTAARRWLERAANNGHLKAQLRLAREAALGPKGSKDQAAARQWYEKAAAQGSETAQYNVALMCETGQGGPRDYEAARRWYEQAAKQGHVGAQTNLAMMLARGAGNQTPQPQEALTWLLIAKGQGASVSDGVLAPLRAVLDQAQVHQSATQAAAWLADHK